jgi:hypothetical protein
MRPAHPFFFIFFLTPPFCKSDDVCTVHAFTNVCYLYVINRCSVSRGSSVSIVSGYGLDDRANKVRSTAEAKRSFVHRVCPERDADHSPPSSAEVENEYELYLLSTQAPLYRIVEQLFCVTLHADVS